MDEFQIRLARIEDTESIVGELSDGVLSGHDYFPAVFREWLAHSPIPTRNGPSLSLDSP